MQKMQAAAGGKGRGVNGAPTPAQIQAMQVRGRQIIGPILLIVQL
jgi:signal recognition particle subunit SRP54